MNSLPVSKKLTKIIIVVFVLALVLITVITYFRLQKLTNNEQDINNSTEMENVSNVYEGKVTYIGDQGNFVSYSLVDVSGNEIVLLRADDQKLQIVEGLNVKIIGDLIKGSLGTRDVVKVKEVLLQNGSN